MFNAFTHYYQKQKCLSASTIVIRQGISLVSLGAYAWKREIRVKWKIYGARRG